MPSAHLLHSAYPGDWDQKYISGSARGFLEDLSGFGAARRRIVVQATPRHRLCNQARETFHNSARDPVLRVDGEKAQDKPGSDTDDEIQVAYFTYLAKDGKFDAKFGLRNDETPPGVSPRKNPTSRNSG